jgi:predicted GIY-YIG superfamily endonuclease
MNQATCNWPLGNGSLIAFNIYASNTNWLQKSGLYIFSYLAANGRWTALYVGQTEDFSARLPSHERLHEAVKLGATHIHTHVVPLQAERDRIEAALIAHLQPPMNIQHR